MEMSDYQRRLWRSMVFLIQDYLEGKNKDFCDLVSRLEGAFEASEINNEVLNSSWYDHWTPLEIWRATKGNDVSYQELEKDLIKIKKFISEVLEGRV